MRWPKGPLDFFLVVVLLMFSLVLLLVWQTLGPPSESLLAIPCTALSVAMLKKQQTPGCTKPKGAALSSAAPVSGSLQAVNGFAPASAHGSGVRLIVLLDSLAEAIGTFMLGKDLFLRKGRLTGSDLSALSQTSSE